MIRVSVPERGLETLFGTHDENLRFVEDTFKVRVKSQGSELLIEGDDTPSALAGQVFEQLVQLMKDGYAVGSLAYEMVAGDVPFSAETPVATMLEHQTRAPAPPRALRPDVPPRLEALILRALEKRADARPQSMTEVATELTAVLADLGLPPVYERPPLPPTPPPGAPTRQLPGPAQLALAEEVVGPAPAVRPAAGTRKRTSRGATLSMEFPAGGARARHSSRRLSGDAPRRGRLAVAAILTAALVVAAIAASTWRAGAPAPAPARPPPTRSAAAR